MRKSIWMLMAALFVSAALGCGKSETVVIEPTEESTEDVISDEMSEAAEGDTPD